MPTDDVFYVIGADDVKGSSEDDDGGFKRTASWAGDVATKAMWNMRAYISEQLPNAHAIGFVFICVGVAMYAYASRVREWKRRAKAE